MNHLREEIQSSLTTSLQRSLINVKVQSEQWTESISVPQGSLKMNFEGNINLSLENLKDVDSELDLSLSLITSQKTSEHLNLPLKISYKKSEFKIQSHHFHLLKNEQNMTGQLDLQILIKEDLDLDISKLLVSNLVFSKKIDLKINSILMDATIRNSFSDIKSHLTLNQISEEITPLKSRIKSIGLTATMNNFSDLKVDTKIHQLNTSIFKIGSIQSSVVKTNSALKFALSFKNFVSEDMGSLEQFTLLSKGSLSSQSASYSFDSYQIKESKYPEISGTIEWRDNLLKGITNLSYALLNPRDFLSFSKIPAKLNLGKNSEKKSEENSLPFDYEWSFEPLNGQVIHIKDELYSLDVQADLLLKSPEKMSGTLRILNGTILYSDYDLRVLDTGYLKFHQKAQKSSQSLELSTTTTSLMGQIAHLSQQEKLIQNFTIKEGIEVHLKLGMNWQDEEIMIKVTGIYPKLSIQLYDAQGIQIKNGFLGLLTKNNKAKKEEIEENEDLSKILGDQAISIANSKIDQFFNNRFKEQGIKIKTNFVPGGKKGFGIQKKMGDRILLDYYRSQDQKDDQVSEMHKVQYILKGNSSLYIRQDKEASSSDAQMSMGLQRRIKF